MDRCPWQGCPKWEGRAAGLRVLPVAPAGLLRQCQARQVLQEGADEGVEEEWAARVVVLAGPEEWAVRAE